MGAPLPASPPRKPPNRPKAPPATEPPKRRRPQRPSQKPKSAAEKARAFKALTHPVRVRVLEYAMLATLISEERAFSPAEVWKAWDKSLPLTHVSYHVRKLADIGALRMVRKKQKRGVVEHLYVPTDIGRAVYKLMLLLDEEG